ncbi:MAG: biotin/lipoyl-binding protein [Fermentimonas sp.]|nr:biotin/lipoyl-binding protein [Fermentimonas sp.]
MKEFKYKINGSPYRVVVTKSENELVELEVNGTPFTVEIEPKTKKPKSVVQRHQLTESSPVSNRASSTTLVTKPSSSSGKRTVESPLPGVILDVRCKIGDSVKKGDTLLILEAMKMENNILADTSGKIVEILIQKGDSVLEGANLVIIE